MVREVRQGIIVNPVCPVIDLNSQKAVVAMLAAGALVAATSVLAKWLGLDSGQTEGLHPQQITAGRYGFALLALTMVLTVRPRLRQHRPLVRDRSAPSRIE